ncbi:MAG: TonB-dependent receptor [Flavobacteriaceae bacterium]
MKRTIAVGTFFAFLASSFALSAQFEGYSDSLPTQVLGEVVLQGRIAETYVNESKSVIVYSAEAIAQSGAVHLVDFLQQVAGLDVRRRGVGPTQADFNLRGGTFDQTLLLIDGIALEDAQTGHHLANFLPPIALIERVEIVRGASSRIYGQNAFSGAINIVTKRTLESGVQSELQGGSFGTVGLETRVSFKIDQTHALAFASHAQSDGYRYNTDYRQQQWFVSLASGSSERPFRLLAFFTPRTFGANGFYASPSAVDQYEETQASLVAATQQFQLQGTTVTPRIYWRRGQDMYEFVRDRPEIYRNMHITHKIGAAVDLAHESVFGKSGIGLDLSTTSIQSNNLGERSRDMLNVFAEHRFFLMNNTFDVTPGVVLNYVSDFGQRLFPGIDVGYRLNPRLKAYLNWGKTFRVPTFTDLYYSDPSTEGNEDLIAEEAKTAEFGIRLSQKRSMANLALFSRTSENLIDYVKSAENERFRASNIQVLQTRGIELEYQYFKNNNAQIPVDFRVAYAYLSQQLSEDAAAFSRYSIDNDLRHHLVVSASADYTKTSSVFASLKWVERATGRAYTVVDLTLSKTLNDFSLRVGLNNLLNQSYWETSLIPMPGRNLFLAVKYSP